MSEIKESLRDEATIRSDSSKYNQGTLAKQLIHEEINTAYNHHVIIDAIKNNRARDISLEPKVNKTSAIILGSGPSLDYSIQFLKDWKGGIFCTTSHALTLMYHGIEPTHIVALDPFCTYDEIKGIDWSKTKTKLIAHPGIWPSLLENWPNEILLYLQNLGDPTSFYATTQKRMYSHREDSGRGMRAPTFIYYIPTEIVVFSCSPPVQMFMAAFLGYGNIFLCGVDFAYHEDKDRFTNYTINSKWIPADNDLFKENSGTIAVKENKWEKHEHPFVKNDKMIKTNNGLFTDEIHLYYKKNMLSAWRLSNQTVYTTDHGSITEIPYKSIESVVKSQGLNVNKQTPQFISLAVERYLASVGAFVVEAKNGVKFIESDKPEFELLNYMYLMFGKYKCDTCTVIVQSNDIIDHENEECPQCKKGKLVHVAPIDIEYNINKFIRLINQAGGNTERSKWNLPERKEK